jgi:corrinoid protein of di/trimethylamine methyltransferase
MGNVHHQSKAMHDLKPLENAILTGNAKMAKAATEQALAAGIAPLKLVEDHMMPAMAEVGRRFECHEYFVPELLLAGRAMKTALELLRPLLAAGSIKSAGRVAIGTVEGDLHDIGKNLVIAMLEGSGYEVIDLGVNVPANRFVAVVKEKNVQVLAMSALLTTTMPAMKTTLAALQEAGVRQQVKILVGGAPITQRYADEIGADGYCETAGGSVATIKQILKLN